MDEQRIETFKLLSDKNLRFGSDCSGADSAFHAASQWATEPSNEMMSEAPDAEAPILFALLNTPPKCFYRDVFRRGFSGYCILNGQSTPTPTDLDMYSAGTVCCDFSSVNTLNPKEFTGAPWKSQKTDWVII